MNYQKSSTIKIARFLALKRYSYINLRVFVLSETGEEK